MMFAGGCSGSKEAVPVFVGLSPSMPQIVHPGGTLGITANVANDPSGKGVSWTLVGVGSLTSQSLTSVTYVAPSSLSSAQNAVVTAASVADPTKSASLQIAVNPEAVPVPFISQPLRPDNTSPGVSELTLTVSGTGFLAGATVDLNGISLSTVFISSQQLTTTVPAAEIAVPETASISVVNPMGVRSNVVFFPVAAPEATVSFSKASGSPFSLGINPAWVAGGDFNGDGKLDLAISNFYTSGTVNILLGKGDGTFEPATGSPIAVGTGPNCLIVEDFNGDGKLDVAVVEPLENDVRILLGNGDGTFLPAPGAPSSVGANPQQVVAGDFNGDGKLDLAVTNANSNNVSVLIGNGDGTFAQAPGSPVSAGNSPEGIAVGDLNGDGTLDLVVTGSPDTVTILLGRGDGAFTPAAGSPITVGSLPDYVLIADFNGDGNLDLAVSNPLSDNVSILLGKGDGTFSPAPGSPIPVLEEPTVVIAGDFNCDGKLDLAVANEQDSTLSILVGNGDGTFTAGASALTTGNDYVAAGDFNGDGRLDLAIVDVLHDTVTILLQP